MNSNRVHNSHSCRCHCCTTFERAGQISLNLNRREFLFRVGAAAGGMAAFPALEAIAAREDLALPVRGPKPAMPLRVQPVLTYDLPKRREATSWRGWLWWCWGYYILSPSSPNSSPLTIPSTA